MELKTFRAYSMAEALAAVKDQLGQDAVILHTRTFRRGGLLGLGRRTVVEVTATPASQSPDRSLLAPSATSPRTRDARSNQARRTYGAAAREATLDERERTRRLALAMTEMRHRERFDSEFTSTPAPAPAPGVASSPEPSAVRTGPRPAPSVRAPAVAAPAKSSPVAEADPAIAADRITEVKPAATSASAPLPSTTGNAPRRFILKPAEESTGSRARVAGPSPGERAVVGAPDNIALMQSELSAIKDLVGQVLQRQTTTSRSTAGGAALQPALPQKLFDMYLKLLAQELSEDLADSIINQVRDELTRAQIDDENQVRVAVMRHLARYIPTADQAITPASPDGRPLTIALIGPTGVGKTTTLAKIAATIKLHQRKHVGLITADTYRIAAVDQLRTYANIIGLPLKVTLTPAEMRQAVHALSDCDVILIDTAGRSQNDAGRLEELKKFIEAADPHEIHLVLSSTASEKVMLQEAEAFSEVGVDKVVLTKLDEAVSFGMLVNVLRHVGKELSFVTTGQEVPDHIECGEPDRLANMILEGKLAS